MNQVSLRPRHGREITCPLCRDVVEPAERDTCGGCQTAYHAECMTELGGCATLGCDRLGSELQQVAAGLSPGLGPEAWEEALDRWRREHDPVEAWIGDRRKRPPRSSRERAAAQPTPSESRVRGPIRTPGEWVVLRYLGQADWLLTPAASVYAISLGLLGHRLWSRGGLLQALSSDTNLWLGVAGVCLASFAMVAHLACWEAGVHFGGDRRDRAVFDLEQIHQSLLALAVYVVLAVPGAPLVYWALSGRKGLRQAVLDRRAARQEESD